MKAPKLRYIFRTPDFPVIFKTQSGTVCAVTPKEIESFLKINASVMDDEWALIDYRREGWAFFPKESQISPLTTKKHYTKREFLLFCGVTVEQIARTNLKKYSREEIFDHVINEAKNTLPS